MQRRFTGILLFLILVVPAVLTYSWLQYRKSMVRKEIKHKMIDGIDKDKLVLLKFSNKEVKQKLKWEHSKEFEYNRQMYDVVEKQVKGDSIYFWCWWDHEETKLNKQVAKLVNTALGKDQAHKETKEHFISYFFNGLYREQFVEWKPKHAITDVEQTDKYSRRHISVFLTPPTPPPRLKRLT